MDTDRQNSMQYLLKLLDESKERDTLKEDITYIKEEIIRVTTGVLSPTSFKNEPSQSEVSIPSLEMYQDYVSVYVYGYNVESLGSQPSGYGVWIADNHPYNVSSPVTITTPRVADLLGCLEALNIMLTLGAKKLKVFINSLFLVNSMQEWIHKWKENDWKNTLDITVRNQKLLSNIDIMSKKFLDVEWVYIDGGHEMNEAEKLAKQGAAKRSLIDQSSVLTSQSEYQI